MKNLRKSLWAIVLLFAMGLQAQVVEFTTGSGQDWDTKDGSHGSVDIADKEYSFGTQTGSSSVGNSIVTVGGSLGLAQNNLAWDTLTIYEDTTYSNRVEEIVPF